MKTPLLAVLFLLAAVACLSGAESDLATRAEAFAVGKTYQLSPTSTDRAAGKYDCTTFVQAVLKDAGYSVAGSTGGKINISPPPANLVGSVRNRDAQIKGVVHALVDSNQGTELAALAEAKPGDIIQMWRIVPGSGSGNNRQPDTAKGHAGIVKEVDIRSRKVTLLGAHNPQDGVGIKVFDLNAGGWPVYFLVRPQLASQSATTR